MIDSHCHLTGRDLISDRDEMLLHAQNNGVEHCIIVIDPLDEREEPTNDAFKFVQRNNLSCIVGVHPHVAKSWDDSVKSKLQNYLELPFVKAIGEIGLDYHYDLSPRSTQIDVFEQQVSLGVDKDIPVVIHTREALSDTWDIINKYKPEKLLLHCCTERYEDIACFLERGYLLSFSGIATYPNADVIRDAIKQCPIEQLLIETDSPFLAPQAYRGKRNEPAHVIEVAKVIANVKNISFDDVDRITMENTRKFFEL